MLWHKKRWEKQDWHKTSKFNRVSWPAGTLPWTRTFSSRQRHEDLLRPADLRLMLPRLQREVKCRVTAWTLMTKLRSARKHVPKLRPRRTSSWARLRRRRVSWRTWVLQVCQRRYHANDTLGIGHPWATTKSSRLDRCSTWVPQEVVRGLIWACTLHRPTAGWSGSRVQEEQRGCLSEPVFNRGLVCTGYLSYCVINTSFVAFGNSAFCVEATDWWWGEASCLEPNQIRMHLIRLPSLIRVLQSLLASSSVGLKPIC